MSSLIQQLQPFVFTSSTSLVHMKLPTACASAASLHILHHLTSRSDGLFLRCAWDVGWFRWIFEESIELGSLALHCRWSMAVHGSCRRGTGVCIGGSRGGHDGYTRYVVPHQISLYFRHEFPASREVAENAIFGQQTANGR